MYLYLETDKSYHTFKAWEGPATGTCSTQIFSELGSDQNSWLFPIVPTLQMSRFVMS